MTKPRSAGNTTRPLTTPLFIRNNSMATPNSTLDQATLKSQFDYDQITGLFTRLYSIHGNPLRRQITDANCNGYIVFEICGRKEYAHRMAWLWVHGVQPCVIDHINGIKTDNRICNLRDVVPQVNLQNRKNFRRNPMSALQGVSPSLKKWTARISVDRKTIHLGSFETKDEAHAAYISAKIRLHAGCATW